MNLKEEGKQRFVLWFEITVTEMFTEKDLIISKLILNLSEAQKRFVDPNAIGEKTTIWWIVGYLFENITNLLI